MNRRELLSGTAACVAVAVAPAARRQAAPLKIELTATVTPELSAFVETMMRRICEAYALPYEDICKGKLT